MELRLLDLRLGPDELVVFGEQLHDGPDRIFLSGGTGPERDFLMFFDSRGMSRGWDASLVRSLIAALPTGSSYHCIVRPLELTAVPSLANFLLRNRITYHTIITNVGFVDCTPKKGKHLQDIERQVRGVTPMDQFVHLDMGQVTLTDATKTKLGTVVYPDRFIQDVSRVIRSRAGRCLLLGTPLVNRDIIIERKRPPSFFGGLARTNDLLRDIEDSGIAFVPMPRFTAAETYDAVHYTEAGNRVILDVLMRTL